MTTIEWRVDDATVLRTLQPHDADPVFALEVENRDRLLPWMPWSHGERSAAVTRAFIERCRSEPAHRLDAIGIWVDDEAAGVMGLRLDDDDVKGELGYWLGRQYEGRGIVTRACRRFLDHGFGQLGLHRIAIIAAVENARSRAIPERLGFTLEGVLRGAERVGDTYHDLVVYSVLADEWRARAGA